LFHGLTSASFSSIGKVTRTFQNWLPSATPPTCAFGSQLKKLAYATGSLFGYLADFSTTVVPTYICIQIELESEHKLVPTTTKSESFMMLFTAIAEGRVLFELPTYICMQMSLD